MRDIIKRHKIKSEFIINVDESAFFWEYLPRKVLCNRFSSKSRCFRRGYHQNRSTLVLGCTAAGTLLRPSLILKRVSPYFLQTDDDIGLLVLNSKSGWMDEANFLLWLEKILIPHVNGNQALLIMDSY